MARLKNEVGNKYNRLEIIARASNSNDGQARWLCKCDCGNQVVVLGSSLRNGRNVSCGCLKVDRWLLPGNEAAFNKLFYRYRKEAKSRGLEYDLSKDEFKKITSNKCHYCGSEPSQIQKSQSDRSDDYIYNGIDRKDNKIGYNIDNCVPCCYLCNRAKMSLDYHDFLEWVKKVYHHISLAFKEVYG